MKKDIESRADIELLVNAFYSKVKTDEVIGFIFNDLVKVNWEKHLPVMVNFWDNALFYSGSYSGNPMNFHQNIHKSVIPLTVAHFEQWINLFLSTVDELFEGEKATLIKQRAVSISTIMQIKILHEYAPVSKDNR